MGEGLRKMHDMRQDGCDQEGHGCMAAYTVGYLNNYFQCSLQYSYMHSYHFVVYHHSDRSGYRVLEGVGQV